MARHEVSEEDRRRTRERLASALADDEGVVLAYLFGSLAREDASHVGDADLAVWLDGDPDERAALEAELELERRLNRVVELPVDVRALNHAPPRFRFAVVRDGHRLVERDPRIRDRFERAAVREYHDLQWLTDRYRRDALGIGSRP